MVTAQRQPGLLGKLAPRFDPRTLRMRSYMPGAGLTKPPAVVKWDHGIVQWGMMRNDRIGDCTCAAMGHAIQLATVNASQNMLTISDNDVITAYSALSGYDPHSGANDNGAVELDVLRYWQKTGIAGHKIAAYGSCSISDFDDVQDCIDIFGFCYIGFNVPRSAMSQYANGQPWDVVPNDGGIEGGHAVIVVDYDTTGMTCITWGTLQRMTYDFWRKYVDEAYGVVMQEWLKSNGVSPSNFNMQQLLQDVQELTQQPDPDPTPAPTPTPTPFTIDPQIMPWLNWEKNVANYMIAKANAAQSQADVQAIIDEQGILAQYATQFAAYLQGHTSMLPLLPGVPLPGSY